MSTTAQHRRPLRYGAAAAVVAAPACFFLFQLIDGGFRGNSLGEFTAIMAFGLVISGPAMLLLGAPWVWLLRAKGLLNVATVCLGAAACGAIALAVLALLFDTSPNPPMLISGAGIGLGSGIAFCLVSGVRLWGVRY